MYGQGEKTLGVMPGHMKVGDIQPPYIRKLICSPAGAGVCFFPKKQNIAKIVIVGINSYGSL